MAEPGMQRVYFAVSGKQVKIGVAVDPAKRVAVMRTVRPDIRLLGDQGPVCQRRLGLRLCATTH